MAISEELKIEITAQSKQAVKELQNTEKALGKTETAAGKIGTALKAAFGAAAIYAGIRKVGELLLTASQLASDAEETFSKFTVVFKDQATEVEAWARTYSSSVGRSSTETMRFAATLQDTFVPLGFARAEAGELSKKLVVLANDVGSFNNVLTDDVIRDFQSALVGNTETLRKYGVVASQAAIVEEALASGLIDTASELDAASKAQAIYQIIVAGTSDAQGDLLRTMDSSANVTIALNTAMSDLGITVGDVVNNYLTPLKARLTDIIIGFNKLADDGGIEKAIKAITIFKDIVMLTINPLGALVKGIRALNQETEDGADTWSQISTGITGTAEAIALTAEVAEAGATSLEKLEEEAAAVLETSEEYIATAALEAEMLLAKEAAIKRVTAAKKEEREIAEGEKKSAFLANIAEEWAARAETQRIIEEYRAANDAAEAAAHELKMSNMEEAFTLYGSYAQGSQQIFSNLINSMMSGDAEMTDKRKKAIIALFRMQQIASIGQIAMNTASAIVEALPNIPLSIAVGAIGLSQGIAAAAAKPPVKLAEGGIVMPTAGGTSAILGEAGQAEAVIPLDRFGNLGTTNNFYISGVVGSIEDVAIKINEGLESARHMGKVS